MARPFPRVLWYFTIWFMKMQQLFEKKFVKKAEIFPTCFVEKFRHKMLCFCVKNGGLRGLSKQKIFTDKRCIRGVQRAAFPFSPSSVRKTTQPTVCFVGAAFHRRPQRCSRSRFRVKKVWVCSHRLRDSRRVGICLVVKQNGRGWNLAPTFNHIVFAGFRSGAVLGFLVRSRRHKPSAV